MFEITYRYDSDRPARRQPPADAQDACSRLVTGNQVFSSLATDSSPRSIVIPIDLEDIGLAAPGGNLKQKPFAVVLGCSDARVPIELIFDRSCNELFVIRVAGNVLGPDQLGSIDYAVGHLGQDLKVVVVLGHSQCGAVTAAVDAFITPVEYLGLASSHHVRVIVNTLFPAVRGAAKALSVMYGDPVVDHPCYRTVLIECSVALNAALMATILQTEFGDTDQDRRFVFGVYDLESRRVHVPTAEIEPVIELIEAPQGHDEFRELARRVVGSAGVRKLLG